MKGKLYICPTPIGNLEDITLRVLRVLQEVDFIAAEDTRHTIKLLNHFDIKKKMISCHEHNESVRTHQIVERLKKGENCALVSDAGMPGISDPGSLVIREAVCNGIEVVGLPGATAFTLALVVSGLDTTAFVFEGFLPNKKGDKMKRLERLRDEERTMIFYESPHRLITTLDAMVSVFGERKIAVSRELTKRYEETIRGLLFEVKHQLDQRELKGEFVLVVEGNPSVEKESKADMTDVVDKLMKEGLSHKEVVKEAVTQFGLNKNEVYQKVLELRKGGKEDDH